METLLLDAQAATTQCKRALTKPKEEQVADNQHYSGEEADADNEQELSVDDVEQEVEEEIDCEEPLEPGQGKELPKEFQELEHPKVPEMIPKGGNHEFAQESHGVVGGRNAADGRSTQELVVVCDTLQRVAH